MVERVEKDPEPRGCALVVDDESLIRTVSAARLRRLGLQVLEAASAEEALEVSTLHAGRIDLLMTDLTMPGMDGSELARELLARRPALRILVASGYAREDLADPAAVPSGAGYLQKPFDGSELAAEVGRLLGTA